MGSVSRPLALAAVVLVACSGNRDKLLADLQSPRPEIRASAVRKLGEQGHDEDLVLLTRAAKDVAAVVRGEAAVALGASGNEQVLDLLGELLQDGDESVQTRAATALAHFKSDKSKAYLTSQYPRRGRNTRIAIVQALKATNVPGPMASCVAAEANLLWDRNLEAFTKGALPERVAAAEELGKSGRAEAVNRLLPLVRDSQVILAAAAVRGLGFAGDRRAVAAIAPLLSENFPELRLAAIEALLRLGDSEALVPLRSVAVEKSASSAAATAAIVGLPRTAATDRALCEMIFQAGAAEAIVAGREMRRRGGCAKEFIAERLPRATEPLAFLAALQGLGPTVREGLPRLMQLLQSNDPNIRRHAIEAAVELGEAQALPHIQRIYAQEAKAVETARQDWVTVKLPEEYAEGFDPARMRDSHAFEEEREGKSSALMARIKALEQAKTSSSARTVIQPRMPAEVADDAPAERVSLLASAIRALGLLGSPDARATLEKHREDPIASVRAAAYVGLTHLGQEGIEAARAGLLEADRSAQGAVADALAQRGEAGQRAILEVLPRLAGDRIRLLEALERHGPIPAASKPLEAIVQEGGGLASPAARLLGALQAKDAVPTLIKYLDDPTGIARRDVLQALGRVGDPSAAEVVARDLYSDSADVRAAAAEALARIGSAAQHEALDALKGDYYRRVRESAELAVARTGGVAGEAPK